MEVFRRAVRRAGGRLALSAGMRPKPLLTLALPLAVGVEGLRELCEFELAEEPAAGFRGAAGRGPARAHGAARRWSPTRRRRSLAARVVGASYEVEVDVARWSRCRRRTPRPCGVRLADGRRATLRRRPASVLGGRDAGGPGAHASTSRRYVERVEVESSEALVRRVR